MKILRKSAPVCTQAAFALPSKDDGFNVIDYVEMPEAESRREIRRINEEGRTFKINNPGMVGSPVSILTVALYPALSIPVK